MRNSSHRPGCMRRFPASHSCHPRRVQWMRAAAAVCESPATSRADRTSSGVGFRAGLPARLRFGCLGIEAIEPAASGGACAACCNVGNTRCGETSKPGTAVRAICRDGIKNLATITTDTDNVEPFFALSVGVIVGDLAESEAVFLVDNVEGVGFIGDGHFGLLPLISRGAVEATAYGSNYTRIACICKLFRKIFFSGRGETAKPSNAELTGDEAGRPKASG